MKVLSAPGTQCPKEGNPRQYITDTEAVEVPESMYYQRLVNDGSLQLVSLPAGKPASKEKEAKADGK